MIFLKVIDDTGNPGLVAVDKILFISSQNENNAEEQIKCRLHLVGDTDNYVDIRNTFDEVVERLRALLGY